MLALWWYAMAQVSNLSISKAALIFTIVAVFSIIAVSAQDAPAPAPAYITGAAFSVSVSGAVLCSSLIVSLLAFLKH
ncbi:hypothetical protein IFM89_023185 [Coptis chinensis]|uniref:Uncharacterized protein n=1 Tax=Coptis chinensis TaxID=261450 RepID=A0A835HXT5_9MAGN|nr:hypothetical protein IFM89_023185 [Coptis chinensis]